MILEDKTIKLSDIYLDPYNPRFTDQHNIEQREIIDKIFKTREAKELLNSMKIDIKWINKIVVIHKDDFTDKQKNVIGIDSANYLVVEGNNRLACLKTGLINGISFSSEIPVLVARKSEQESIENFQAQLRVTQGIANVMVVKEWSVIAKAKHLHTMFNDLIKKNADQSVKPHEIHKDISNELGLKITDVRQMIVRYEFFNTINAISDSIPEDHWGYLEAFDKNLDIRTKFGMNPETNQFIFDKQDDEYTEEILMEIPALIDKAVKDGINTKQFRDIISKLIEDKSDKIELFELITEITCSDSSFNFLDHVNQQSKISEQETWFNNITNMMNTLSSFPVVAKWASEQIELLNDLKNITNKIIGKIDDDKSN